MILITFY